MARRDLSPVRIFNEQKVYDGAPFDASSGELLVWDDVIYPSVIRHRHYSFLEAVVGPLAPRNVLDVGCGAGWMSHYLSQFSSVVIGIDVSRDLLLSAHRTGTSNTCFLLADGGDLPIADDSLDLIVSAAALHHLVVIRALREWRRVLRPGGELILFEPNNLNPLASAGRKLFPLETHTEKEEPLNPNTLRMLLSKNGWEILRWETQILFSFVVSRIFRLLRVPRDVARAFIPPLDKTEDLLQEVPFLNQLGWVIFCVARTSG